MDEETMSRLTTMLNREELGHGFTIEDVTFLASQAGPLTAEVRRLQRQVDDMTAGGAGLLDARDRLLIDCDRLQLKIADLEEKVAEQKRINADLLHGVTSEEGQRAVELLKQMQNALWALRDWKPPKCP